MKAGKGASLCLLVAIVACAAIVQAVVMFTDIVPSSPPALAWMAVVGLQALAFLALLVPVGHALDRTMKRLRSSIEDAAETSEGSTPFLAPRWLKPITATFTDALRGFEDRESRLKSKLRDQEIRRRVAEAEHRQIRTAIDTLTDGVIVTDAFNEVIIANHAAAKYLGFDLDGAEHRGIEAVLTDKQLCRLILDTRESANTKDIRHVERRIQYGDTPEQSRVYDISLVCAENHKNEVAGVVTIFHDVTREREIAQRETDFVSKASHELRTPLSSIRAYVEMLVDKEAEDEESRQEFYRIIQNETDRLGRLIDNMLNISRIEAGIVQIDRDMVDTSALIDRAFDTIEPQAREKDITLHKKIAPVDLTVEGDADMLFQVVLNLMSNAVKYTPDGGRITVSADSDNLTRSVLVSVADTGLGIPPDALGKLFDKFYRVENYKRVAKGTGLGLSLCKHIVETVHGGQIGIESKLGMGSRFWYSVPMRYAGSQAAA